MSSVWDDDEEVEVSTDNALNNVITPPLDDAEMGLADDSGMMQAVPMTQNTDIEQPKPHFSYAALIAQAIESTSDNKMTLSAIYSWISTVHPYYKLKDLGWQNSVRHNLSLNKCFLRVPKSENDTRKGAFWAIDPSSKEALEKSKRRGRPKPGPISTAEPAPLSPALSTSPSIETPSDPQPAQSMTPPLKRRKLSSTSESPQSLKLRRFSTSDTSASDKLASTLKQARQMITAHSSVSFRRHSTPNFRPSLPTPTSFVITSRLQGDFDAHRSKSESPKPKGLPKSRLKSRPVEEYLGESCDSGRESDFEDEDEDEEEDDDEGFAFHAESEDHFDNRVPSEETLRRIRVPSVAAALGNAGLRKNRPPSTTFEVPSHTSAHSYEVSTGSETLPFEASRERMNRAKGFPSSSLVITSYGGSVSNQLHLTSPRSQGATVRELGDLDWSGNLAVAEEELFFIRECADPGERNRLDDLSDLEVVV